MSLTYSSVGWNRQKKIYDLILVGGIVGYLALFIGFGAWLNQYATIETLLIRGIGTCALLLLHIVLIIGPLCRIDPRFLPLLYNRRHLGVTTFVLGLAHAGLAIFQFHALGDLNPFVSLLISNTRFGSLGNFPFQQLGLGALVILFLMAATSHDFWLANLSAPVWKRLHMLVYVAYALLIAHVTLGVLQAEHSPLLAAALGLGLVTVITLHVIAARREHSIDHEPGADESTTAAGFVDVCGVEDIAEKRARIVTLGGERLAVFKYDGCVSALSNVCQHQNGPLGEGRIIDGCVTCPWHGFQYLPETGASPPPFGERVPTFRVRVERGRVLVDPRPLPPGTRVEAARIDDSGSN